MAQKTTENKHPEALVQPVLTSPVKNKHQTRLKTQNNPSDPYNVIDSKNSPLPPRVVTLEKRGAAPPKVLARVRNLSPRNLFHEGFLHMGSSN